MGMLVSTCINKLCHKLITKNHTYELTELMAIQSLREQEETREAEMQKAADRGGCVLPGDTTQPNAT